MRRAVLYLVAVALLPPVQAISAQRLPIRPGQRINVRSSATRPDRIEGIYVGTIGDTLYAQTLGSGRSVAIPVASVTRIERWAGHRFRQSNIGRGALYGALVGGFVGFVGLSNQSGSIVQFSAGQSVGIAVLFAAIGAVPGAIAGALIKTDRCEEVPLDRMRVSFAPQRDGFALGLSVSF